MRYLFCLIFYAVPTQAVFAQPSDTFSVYFPLNISTLTATAQQEIDSLFYIDWINSGSKIQVVGYADMLGGAGACNQNLSSNRAHQVADYLMESGVRAGNILLIAGKGAVMRSNNPGHEGYPSDRRVDLVRLGSEKTENKTTPIIPSAVLQPEVTKPPPVSGKGIDLSKVRENEVLQLENIYFYASRHVVRPESYPAMHQLLESLRQHPNIRIRIEGHICCVHTGPDGMDIDLGEPVLSQSRAFFIYQWLVDQGIAKERLEWKGYGRTRPLIFVETSEADAQKNRRVEIRILAR